MIIFIFNLFSTYYLFDIFTYKILSEIKIHLKLIMKNLVEQRVNLSCGLISESFNLLEHDVIPTSQVNII